MAVHIYLRHDTAANWTSINPILGLSEFGYETDTGKLKVGDGVTAWNSLLYFKAESVHTTADVADSTDKRYVTDIEKTKLAGIPEGGITGNSYMPGGW
jgi:hypothetical protein